MVETSKQRRIAAAALVAAAAGVGVTGSGGVASAAPAPADGPPRASEARVAMFPPPCRLLKSFIKLNGQLLALNTSVCDDGSEAGFPVRIQRKNSDGTFTTVASGVGDAVYTCKGSALRTYRVPELGRALTVACS